MDSLHPAIPVGMLELIIMGFECPSCCPSPVYSCLFAVYKWKNLHIGSYQDLSFVECLNKEEFYSDKNSTKKDSVGIIDMIKWRNIYNTYIHII